jgi:hypothetical protein
MVFAIRLGGGINCGKINSAIYVFAFDSEWEMYESGLGFFFIAVLGGIVGQSQAALQNGSFEQRRPC